MNILKRYGDNLKKIRTDAGLSQERLAELTGLHRTYISFLERGLRNPSLETINKIAIVLDKDISVFFDKLD